MITIEIFPANKTCEQGCSVCPLAKKNSIVTATEIDSEVQRTFSFLESKIKESNLVYDLHFPSSFHLFPSLRYPKIINMARFATNSDIYLDGNAKHFSENVRSLIKGNGIDPKIIGFSIVPHLSVVSSDEMNILDEIVKELSSWYFKKSTKKEINITIRNNLIKLSLFNKVLPRVFEADFIHLKNFIERHARLDYYKMLMDSDMGDMYNNYYSGKILSNQLTIGHRVIANKEIKTIDEHTKQAFWFSTRNDKSSGLVVAPKGVMFEHSSLAINNPVLWVSHDDFRGTLEKDYAKSKFSFPAFSQEIILVNASMYAHARKKFEKKGARIKSDDFMTIFKEWRHGFTEQLRKSRGFVKKPIN